MNKLSKLMMGLAALSFAACSSDEPAPTPAPGDGDGTTMYLKVRIKSADMGSRADNVNSDNEEGAYDWGTPDEHTVKTADFFFFDENKVYVTQANVWDGGNETKPDVNVEYISENVLVLKGLTKQHAPKYMVTVLNADPKLKEKLLANVTTLDSFREEICNYTEIQGDDVDKSNLFVMSTSSYYDGAEGFEYGANTLTDDMLSVQKPELDEDGNTTNIIDPSKLKYVDVYVERLAAKYTMNAANKKSTIQITVSGFGNEQSGSEAYETVDLEISGFGVTNIADQSYITKNIQGFDATTPWAEWQAANFYRSFWAKSYNYNATDRTGLSGTKFAQSNDNLGSAVYSNENTKPFAALKGDGGRVKADLTTNVVFTAKITKDGNELKLVNFNGLYFKEEQFVKYVLFRLNENGSLNLWKQVSSTTSTDEEGVTVNGQKYVQVGPDEVEIVRPDVNKKDAHMTLKAIASLPALFSYDEKAEDGNKFTAVNNAATVLNNAIDQFFQIYSNGEYPVRFNGYTVYTKPIEHLLGSNNNTDYKVTKDGEYGVVRNHWYNFEVSKILNMGEGVFNPGTGEDGDVIIPDPDPKPEQFALAARVNILSWKIVRQTIEL